MAFQCSSLTFNGKFYFKDINSLNKLAHFCSSSSSLKQSGYIGKTFQRSRPLVQQSNPRLLKPCRVKFEGNLEGTTSGEIFSLEIEAMERDLSIAIEEENYDRAAKIRDNLKLLKENGKTRVLSSNARFYDAFRAGDLATMQTLWAKNDEVCCAHPGARGISGYEDVMTSWEYVWANYEFPLDIELKDVKVNVRGDMGYVTCIELVRTKGSSWGGQFVTNVFERVDDQWLISVHHASPIDL